MSSSSSILKKATPLFNRFLLRSSSTPSPPLPFTLRRFNSRAQSSDDSESDDDEFERGLDIYHRCPLRRLDPNLFIDMFDPFLSTRGGLRRGWDIREDEKAVYVKGDMPGVGKEDVKVSVEQDSLVIKGQEPGEESSGDGRKYSTRFDIVNDSLKLDAIKAEMKNGVLKVFIPKMEEEKKDVIQVHVN